MSSHTDRVCVCGMRRSFALANYIISHIRWGDDGDERPPPPVWETNRMPPSGCNLLNCVNVRFVVTVLESGAHFN